LHETIIKTRKRVLAGPTGARHATRPSLDFKRATNLNIHKLPFLATKMEKMHK
jgi:hypothetical protein